MAKTTNSTKRQGSRKSTSRQPSPMMSVSYPQDALNMMQAIAYDIQRELDIVNNNPTGVSGYVQQREVINRVFQNTTGNGYSLLGIIQRLTVIDSLYSTNARFSYYSIEQLAAKIYGIGSEQAVADYFDGIVRGGKDTRNLFSAHYGIRKNLENGGLLMSLVSKYAYYVLLQDAATYPLGFPIYDSLVVGVISEENPCEYFGIDEGKTVPKNLQAPSIEDFVATIDKVRVKLLGNTATLFDELQQFDILDAYLWRMGKLYKGNYSLLLTCDDYCTFVDNLGLANVNSQLSPLLQGGKVKFGEAVREQCSIMPIGNIVRGLSNTTLMGQLIEHWNKYYKQS